MIRCAARTSDLGIHGRREVHLPLLRVGRLHVGQLIDIAFAERNQLAAVQQLLVRQHLAVFFLEQCQFVELIVGAVVYVA